MPRGGRREGAGRKHIYLRSLDGHADDIRARLKNILIAARAIEAKVDGLLAGLSNSSNPAKIAASVNTITLLEAQISSQRAQIVARLINVPAAGRGELSTESGAPAAGRETGGVETVRPAEEQDLAPIETLPLFGDRRA